MGRKGARSRPRGDPGAASGEKKEEDKGQKITSEQKLAVSREMTNLLMERIKALSQTFNAGHKGLELDTDGEADGTYYSTMNHARDSIKKRKASVAESEKTTTISRVLRDEMITMSPHKLRAQRRSSVVSMDYYHVKGSAPPKVAPEHKERYPVIAKLRKELGVLEAGLMGRMIDNVVYTFDAEPPFEVDINLVLRYIAARIAVPYTRKFFAFDLMRPLSQKIVLNLFWFMHCYCFQNNSIDIQDKIVARLSSQYIELVHSIKTNRDLFLASFPYATADAVYFCFYYFVPGSRNLYDLRFRLQLFVIIVRLLTGMDVTTATVERKSLELFPDEVPEQLMRARKVTSSEDKFDEDDELGQAHTSTSEFDRERLGSRWVARVESLRSLRNHLIVPSLGPPIGAPGAIRELAERNPIRVGSASKVAGVAPAVPDLTVDPDTLDPVARVELNRAMSEAAIRDVKRRSRRRQLRTGFVTTNTSALMQRYLGKETPAMGKKPVRLARTSPVPWSRVGGVDTFHAVPVSKMTYAERDEPRKRRKEHLFKESLKLRADRKKEREDIRQEGEIVLGGGVAQLAKYTLKLAKAGRNRGPNLGKRSDAMLPPVRARDPLDDHVALLPTPSMNTNVRYSKPPTKERGIHKIRQKQQGGDSAHKTVGGWTPWVAAMEYGLHPSQLGAEKGPGGGAAMDGPLEPIELARTGKPNLSSTIAPYARPGAPPPS